VTELLEVVAHHVLGLGVAHSFSVAFVEFARGNVAVVGDNFVERLLVEEEFLSVFLFDFRFRFRNCFADGLIRDRFPILLVGAMGGGTEDSDGDCSSET
jgi:hypothetical protein